MHPAGLAARRRPLCFYQLGFSGRFSGRRRDRTSGAGQLGVAAAVSVTGVSAPRRSKDAGPDDAWNREEASACPALPPRSPWTSSGSAGADRCSSTKAGVSAPRADPPLTAELDEQRKRGMSSARTESGYRIEAQGAESGASWSVAPSRRKRKRRRRRAGRRGAAQMHGRGSDRGRGRPRWGRAMC
jgi:hypothetical protein